MSDKIRIFLASSAMYLVTGVLCLAAAWQHVIRPETGAIAQIDLSLQNIIIFAAVFIIFTYVMVRFSQVARYTLKFFLLAVLVAGAQFILAAWIGYPANLIIAILLALSLWLFPRVFVHDIAIIAGVGGIAGVLGLSLTPLIACVLLAGLSVYDVVSVYRTRHMVVLAEHMIDSGAVFGFLIPATFSKFFMLRSVALQTRSVMMLGAGDIGLPLVLAASALSTSIAAAVMVFVFSLVGVSLMFLLFSRQGKSAPMAALPPIAASAILGYMVAILLRV